MGDSDYIFAVARIRVKETSLLKDADISQMAGMKDVKDVMAFLSDRGWGDGTVTQDAETMLAQEEEKTWSLMNELKLDPAVFQLLSLPKLYHNLKAAIKETCSGEVPDHTYFDVDRYGRDEMLRIVGEKNFQALPAHMKQAAEKAYEIMVTLMDGQRCDIIIDRACMEACLDAGRKSKNRLLEDYEESTAAVTNIKIAVRSVKTNKQIGFLKEALAPCSSIDVGGLAAAASMNTAALLEYLEGHGYREAAEALRESASAFERWCDNRVIETILPQKRNSLSAGPIVAYYLARENEIKTVRIIITAKANGFSEESTRERVRMMYG